MREKNLNAWEVCLLMMKRGVLAKPTHDDIVRLSPPLVINESQINQSLEAVRGAVKEASERL